MVDIPEDKLKFEYQSYTSNTLILESEYIEEVKSKKSYGMGNKSLFCVVKDSVIDALPEEESVDTVFYVTKKAFYMSNHDEFTFMRRAKFLKKTTT